MKADTSLFRKQRSTCAANMHYVDNVSDSSMDELEDDFVVVADDMFAKWASMVG